MGEDGEQQARPPVSRAPEFTGRSAMS